MSVLCLLDDTWTGTTEGVESSGSYPYPVPHAQNPRAFEMHYGCACCFVRGGLLRKFWAAKAGESVVVPEGPSGFGSPSWRILGSAPQAELGAIRSSKGFICERYAVISTNKAWEG